MSPNLVGRMAGMLMISPAIAVAVDTVPPPSSGGGTTAIYLDNDVFGGEDRDYTNGFRWAWLSEPMDSSETGSPVPFTRIFEHPFFGNSDDASHSYGFSFTQLMFTPDDKMSFDQPEGERRYAGWLGIGVSLHARDQHVLNSLEFTLGTTGPNSLAEKSQNALHGVINSDEFNGWDNQIPNEVTADVSFTQKHYVDVASSGDFSTDGIMEWGLRLGTFRTMAHLGASFRGGYNLSPDFSDLRLSETAYSHPGSLNNRVNVSDWSAYFVGGALVRGIAHDATLDGPLFRDFDTGNTREPLVAEGFFGFGVSYRDIELSYVRTWRTAEYEEQDGISGFGTVGLRFQF